ncbi:unnamed protein product [Schistosoma curassoni]|uniref:RGS domain-containing protein n=1 Tax=Schistosoma curassoni TaxID=6186 RepID=A0A183KIF9_9TREM|nr:unnamed protein product [Schistosoma curassoni]
MKESSRTNLDSMAEFRAKSDTNWLQQGEIGSEKLYTEIHEFLKNQVIDDKCSPYDKVKLWSEYSASHMKAQDPPFSDFITYHSTS